MSELPSTWAPIALESVTDIVRGITFPASAKQFQKSSLNVCCLRTTNIQREIRWDDVYFVSQEYVKRDAQLVQTGDVLMSMANSYELVGKVAVARIVPYQAAFGAFLSAIRPKEWILGQYLFHFLRSERVQREIRKGSSQTTNIANISSATLSQIQVPLAPLNEQKRIADKLDAVLARVDACRERLDRIPAILKRFRQSVLAAATSGELTADWREERRVVKSWEEPELGQLICEGPTNGLYKPSSAYGRGTRILRIDNFYDGEVREWETLKRLAVNEKEIDDFGLRTGDIVINRVNSLPYLGKSALIRNLPEPCVYESNMMKFRLDTSKAMPEYCIVVLNSPNGIVQLRRNAKHAVNQASINQSDVRSVTVPLPDTNEQREIVRRIAKLFAYADRVQVCYTAASSRVESLTPALLAKAFRGELVTQDPDDEPASVLLERIRAARAKNSHSSIGRGRRRMMGRR